METKRHSKGHSINQFISNRINKSTNLMSSENQTSLLSKTVQQDHSIEISVNVIDLKVLIKLGRSYD